MDKRYEVYALADRHFYETPDRISAGEAPVYETTRREVPEGWDAARIGDWLTLTPLGPDGKAGGGTVAGLEDPRLGHPGERGAHRRDRVGLLRAPAHLVQVRAGPASAAPAQHQVRGPRHQRQVRHRLPGRRGAAARRAAGAGRAPRRLRGAVHPHRSALARRAALRPLRRLRTHLRRRRAGLAGARGAQRRGDAGAGPAGAVLPGAGVGDAARLS